MSVYYIWDLTNRREKDKRHHDLIVLSEWAPPQLGHTSELATTVDRRGTSTENAQKGESSGDSSTPNWDPALSPKVTLSGPMSGERRGPTSYGLIGPTSYGLIGPTSYGLIGPTSYGLIGPCLLSKLHFLTSILRGLGVA
jgi:hypothetical protein